MSKTLNVDLKSPNKKIVLNLDSIRTISDQDNSDIDSDNSFSEATALEEVSSYGSRIFLESNYDGSTFDGPNCDSPTQQDPLSVSAISLDSHFALEEGTNSSHNLIFGNLLARIKADPEDKDSQEQVSAKLSEIHGMLQSSYYQIPELTDHSSNFSNKWKFVCDSTQIQNTCGFYCQVWENPTEKTLAFVIPGTKNDFSRIKGANWQNLYGGNHLFKDLINDWQFSANQVPIQYYWGVEKFIDSISTSFSKYVDYKLICTGHSLGAILSDLSALYLHKFNVFESIESMTLENPGSFVLMEKSLQDLHKLEPSVYGFTLESIQNKFNIINNKHNFINTYEKQFGDVFENEIDFQEMVSSQVNDNFLKEQIANLFSQLGYASITILEERFMKGLLVGLCILPIKESLSKTIKYCSNEFMTVLEQTLLHHSDIHYKDVKHILYKPDWSEGEFHDLISKQLNSVRTKIDSLVANSKIAGNAFKLVENIKKTSVSARSTVNEKLEKFCEFLDSDRPISQFFTEEATKLYGFAKEKAINKVSSARTSFNGRVEEFYEFGQDLIRSSLFFGVEDLGLTGECYEDLYSSQNK